MPVAVPRYTVADLASFPPDGQRYELLDGILIVTPAPAERHQAILSRLLAPLLAAVVVPNRGRVASPGRILSGSNVSLEPDILVYPTPQAIDADWGDLSTWWLAIEVLSPSTRVYDTEWKRQAYQALGVECTWLVDPSTRRVTSWTGADAHPITATDTILWSPRALPDVRLVISLAELFR
jgi:Uma2 family endonuclease